MDKKKIFLGLGIFWLVILGGFIGFKEFTLRSGTEILLKTIPVDPRDFFRGDYVILRYEMSRIDLAQFSGSPTFATNDSIYVEIEKAGDGYGRPVRLYKEVPQNTLFIKGTIKYLNGNHLEIEYGIESYFIPAGKGYVIEQKRGEGVDAKVVVDKFGNAIVKTVLIDGEEIDFNSVQAKN